MARRAAGEGSIVKRSDGRWMVRLPLWEDGRRRRITRYARTQSEARRLLTTLRKELDVGQSIPSTRSTVGQFLSEWLENTVPIARRPRTVDLYTQVVRQYLTGLFSYRLDSLEPKHVQALIRKLERRGLSPRTIAMARGVLRHALNDAIKWGLVARNVATIAEPPRQQDYEARTFTQEETGRFLKAIEGHRLEALYRLTIGLGLRRGEVLGLRWLDVEVDRLTDGWGKLHVTKQLQTVRGVHELVDLKTKRSRRVLPLPPVLVDSLRNHRERQLGEAKVAGGRWHNQLDLVFTTSNGTPLEGHNVTHRFQAFLETHGLPRLRFHDLRHSCATALLAQGVDLRVIMEILGHSQISLTANLYAHVEDRVKREALSRVSF